MKIENHSLYQRAKYYDMDFSEVMKIIFSRIQKVEPENVVKIMGCIFLNEPSEDEMIELAFGPENTLLSKIADSKALIGIISSKIIPSSPHMQSISDHHQYSSSFPPGPRPFSSLSTFHPNWHQHIQNQNFDFTFGSGDYSHRNQGQLLNLDDQIDPTNQIGNYYFEDCAVSSKTSRRSPSLPDFPIKPCYYYYKGFCKHGATCRYFHGWFFPDDYTSQMLSPNVNELGNEEHGFLPGSLEKLEFEITELLRSKRGMAVSIASLPMLYYEKYGRNLQAEGYLTESQRHGKAGFSLTKLLARLKNSIRLIDRPHGQHAVILAEDAPRCMDYRNERSEPGAIVASSHQIYLTFPAESIFSEDDVSNYFKQYGTVRDVRIPSQEKRMFGFVSFVYPDTVNTILMKRNPHYICGARVLVKPYREKLRIIDRNYVDKIMPLNYYPSHYIEMDPEFHSIQSASECSGILKKHLIEEHEKIDIERRHISELNIVQKPACQQSYFNLNEIKLPEGPDEFPLMDHFSFTLDALNNCPTSDEKARPTSNHCDQESSQIDLPESPFASQSVATSISAVM